MTRPFEVLFAPRSVAVVGASATPSTWGFHLARGALTGRAQRRVHLVNHKGGGLDGVTFAPSLTAVGDLVDLVVVAVPAASFESVVDEALAVGARAVIGVTSGLSAGRARLVADRVREAGAVLLGPNCMGVFDSSTGLSLLWGELPAGQIAVLSQSGNLAIEMGMIAARAGLGFSRFASVGNAVDVTATDLLSVCGRAEATRAVALYLESVGDGREFLRAAAELVDDGIPVTLLAAGRSAVGARAVVSHTGALAGHAAVLAAACREAGVRLVETPTQLVEAARAAALGRRRVGGTRLGIVGDGGGHGVVAADLAEAAGLRVVAFSSELADSLARQLPDTANTANPVDLAGGGERDLGTYARVVGEVAASGEVDAVLLTGYFGGYGVDEPALAPVELAVAEAIAGSAVPVVAHSMAAQSATCRALAAGGVPVWPAIEHTISALASLADPVQRRSWRNPTEPTSVVVGAPEDGYFAARELVARYRVAVARALPAVSGEDAVSAAASMGFPVVLKATGLMHKSDVGGVALGLGDADAVRRAWERMRTRLAPTAYSVEEMVDQGDGVEMFVGARRDAAFGPVVVVGMGGVLAELFADTAVALAPLDVEVATALVGRLRGAALLTGFRGRPALDQRALVDVIVAVGQLLVGHPGMVEIDLNPVLVRSTGAVALDVHIGWSEIC